MARKANKGSGSYKVSGTMPFGFGGGMLRGAGGIGGAGGGGTGTGGGNNYGGIGGPPMQQATKPMTIEDWAALIMGGYGMPGKNGVGMSGIAPAMAFMGLHNMAPNRHGLGTGNNPYAQINRPGGSNNGGGGGNGGGGNGNGNGNGNGGGGGGLRPPTPPPAQPFREPNLLTPPPIGTGAQWRFTMR